LLTFFYILCIVAVLSFLISTFLNFIQNIQITNYVMGVLLPSLFTICLLGIIVFLTQVIKWNVKFQLWFFIVLSDVTFYNLCLTLRLIYYCYV